MFLLLLFTALCFGSSCNCMNDDIKIEEIKKEEKEPYDYVIDVATFLYPNQEKGKNFIKSDAGIGTDLETTLSTSMWYFWGKTKSLVGGNDLEKDIEESLNLFLTSLTIPKDLSSYEHTSDLSIENRSNDNCTYDKIAPILGAFMCNTDGDMEEKIKNYVLEKFNETKLKEITELPDSSKKILTSTINFMFSSANINKIIDIDFKVIKYIRMLQAYKKRIAFVHNMPGYLDLKDIKNDAMSMIIDVISKNNLYISGKKGCLTTDPTFYKNLPLTEKSVLITTCSSNSLDIIKNKTFDEKSILYYNYKDPKKLKKELNIKNN